MNNDVNFEISLIKDAISTKDINLLKELSTNKLAMVRKYVCKNENVTEEILKILIRDTSWLVVEKALENAKSMELYVDLLKEGIQNKDKIGILYKMITIHPTNKEFIEAMVNEYITMTPTPENLIYKKVLTHLINSKYLDLNLYKKLVNLSSRLNKKVLKRYNAEVLSTLMHSMHCTPGILKKIFNNSFLYMDGKEAMIYENFILHPQCTKNMLIKLAKCKHLHESISKHPLTPIETLWLIESESKIDIRNHPNYKGYAIKILEVLNKN